MCVVSHIGNLQVVTAFGNVYYAEIPIEVGTRTGHYFSIFPQHNIGADKWLAVTAVDDGAVESSRIETESHLVAIESRNWQHRAEFGSGIVGGGLEADEWAVEIYFVHSGARQRGPCACVVDAPRPEEVAVAGKFVQRLVEQRQAQVGLYAFGCFPVAGVGIADLQMPLLFLSRMKVVAKCLDADVQPAVGPCYDVAVVMVEDPAVAHRCKCHRDAVLHFVDNGDVQRGCVAAVKNHHPPAVDFGNAADAVVEGLITEWAAEL